MCRALAIWLNSWSAATHMKSAYMNSTTGRNRPSSATPPPSPVNAFSLIGVPRTRSGRAALGPGGGRVVPAVERVPVLPHDDDALVGAHPPVHDRGDGVDELRLGHRAGEG